MEENKNNSNIINIDDFAKVEIRLGTIVDAKEVEGSDKLYQLTVDFGEYEGHLAAPSLGEFKETLGLSEPEDGSGELKRKLRNVMSGIRKYRSIEDLVGRQFPFVTNLAPRKMMGKYMSEAMILAASDDSVTEDVRLGFSLFPVENKLPNGTRLR